MSAENLNEEVVVTEEVETDYDKMTDEQLDQAIAAQERQAKIDRLKALKVKPGYKVSTPGADTVNTAPIGSGANEDKIAADILKKYEVE